MLHDDLSLEALAKADELTRGRPEPAARRIQVHIATIRASAADNALDYEAASRWFERARGAVAELTSMEQVHLLASSGLSSLRHRDAEEGTRWLEEALVVARASGDDSLLARALGWSALGQLVSGDRGEAISRLKQALALFETCNDIVSQVHAQYALAKTLIDTDLEAAHEAAEAAISFAKAGAVPLAEIAGTVLRARMHSDERAEATIRSQMVFVKQSADPHDLWSAWLSLIVVLVRRGKLDVALAEIEALQRDVARFPDPHEIAWIARYACVIRALRGDALPDDEFCNLVAEAIARGVVDDPWPFNEPCLRLLYDHAPPPLVLLAEIIAVRAVGHTMRIYDDGQRIELPDGTVVDFGAKHLLQRLMLALCDAHRGEALSVDDVIALGWPDETMAYESGVRRVYSAIRNLRKLGFEDLVQTVEDGYCIDPDVVVIDER